MCRFFGAVIILLILCFLGVEKASGQSRDSVFYFIDSDSKKENQTAGTYVHTGIHRSLMKNSDSLLLSYKIIISSKYPAETDLTATYVFRWDHTLEGIKKSYAAKEEKMKKRGYNVILIE